MTYYIVDLDLFQWKVKLFTQRKLESTKTISAQFLFIYFKNIHINKSTNLERNHLCLLYKWYHFTIHNNTIFWKSKTNDVRNHSDNFEVTINNNLNRMVRNNWITFIHNTRVVLKCSVTYVTIVNGIQNLMANIAKPDLFSDFSEWY